MTKQRAQGLNAAPDAVQETIKNLLKCNAAYCTILAELKQKHSYKSSITALNRYRKKLEKNSTQEAESKEANQVPPRTITITFEVYAPADVQVRIVTREVNV